MSKAIVNEDLFRVFSELVQRVQRLESGSRAGTIASGDGPPGFTPTAAQPYWDQQNNQLYIWDNEEGRWYFSAPFTAA